MEVIPVENNYLKEGTLNLKEPQIRQSGKCLFKHISFFLKLFGLFLSPLKTLHLNR